jgi:ACS family glucarate transporter-like MFS transporter
MSNPLPLATGSRATNVRFFALGWFCSLSMITYIDRVCIMQVQDEIKYDLSITEEQFSWVFSAFALAYALFEVPTGWLGDRLGSRKVLIRIVLCWLVFTALTGLVWGLMSLLIVRFLFGLGEAGAYPNMARGARNWFPFTERGRAQGLIWTFGRWGGAVAPVLIVALAEPFLWLGLPGWRGAFILLGVLGLLWVWGFSMWYRDTPRQNPAVNQAELAWIEGQRPTGDNPAPLSWSAMLSSSTLWCLSFMYFCSNAGWSFFITYVSKYLKRDLQLEGWSLHVAAGMPLLLGGIGCILGGLFTDRMVHVLGRRWGRTLQGLLAYAAGGCFFLTALELTETNSLLAFGFVCLASMLKDGAMAASWATTLDIGHRFSGTVAGLMNSIGNLGTVVSPPIAAWLARLAGTEAEPNWSVSLYYYGGMFFVASVCWFFINPRKVIVYGAADHEALRSQGVLD